MKNTYLIPLALLVYLILAICMMPARFALNFVTLPQDVKLGAVDGTVWGGTVSTLHIAHHRLEQLTWQVNPLALFTLKLQADVTLGHSASELKGKGKIAITTAQKLSINQFNLDSNLSYLSSLYPLPMGLNATGQVKLNVAHFVYSQPWCDTLDGHLVLTNGTVGSMLGQVAVNRGQVSLTCDKGALVAIMKPNSNSLGIDATATLSGNYQLTVNGQVVPPADAPRDFVNLLQFSSRADSQGAFPIAFSTRLN